MANFHMVNALSMNIKDSRWLQLEVCREYQRNKCTRSDTECKFAHPLPHVEVQNGKVTACFDSIKGRCNREKPPCKYFHPPQHLKEQLLINGRNNLAIKNALVQQFATGSLPVAGAVQMTSPTAPLYSLPPSMSQLYAGTAPAAVGEAGGLVASMAVPPLQQKLPRSDRLEVCREFQRGACKRAEQECRYAHPPDQVAVDDGQVTVCMDAVKGRCGREPCRYFHPPSHLQVQLRAPRASPALHVEPPLVDASRKRPWDAADDLGEPAYDAQVYFGAFPGMGVAYKRSAGDKSGLPCYPAASAASYQQLLLQQQQQQQQSYLQQAPCNNAHSVTYTDSVGQLLDNLPVCQDFRKGACVRPACKFVHYVPDCVEITGGHQVTVCRDSVRGQCARPRCKFYHLPVPLGSVGERPQLI